MNYDATDASDKLDNSLNTSFSSTPGISFYKHITGARIKEEREDELSVDSDMTDNKSIVKESGTLDHDVRGRSPAKKPSSPTDEAKGRDEQEVPSTTVTLGAAEDISLSSNEMEEYSLNLDTSTKMDEESAHMTPRKR